MSELLGEITIGNDQIKIWKDCYQDRNRLAIQATVWNNDFKFDEPYATVSSNFIDATLADDEFILNWWNMTETTAQAFRDCPLWEDTGRRERSGHVEAPVMRLRAA